MLHNAFSKLIVAVVLGGASYADGCSYCPFSGLRYATLGPSTNTCPQGSTMATQAQCDYVASVITSPSPDPANYDELLQLLRTVHGSRPTQNFGTTNALVQTVAATQSYSSGPKGCFFRAYPTGSSHDDGRMTFNSHTTGGTSNSRVPLCLQNAWLAGDPHLGLPGGGRADLRGEDGEYFVMHSAPNTSLAMMTTLTHFQQNYGAQTVHGSHFTKAVAVLRTNSTGKRIEVTIDAATTPWFPPYATVHISGAQEPGTKTVKVAFHGDAKKTAPSFALEGVVVNATSRNAVVLSGAGWEYTFVRRTLFKALPGSKANYLNLNIVPVRADPTNAHGIIGQAFGFGKKVDGKLDDYNGTEVTTSAQAEGAIEGVYTDYKVDNPFNTTFQYSRFDAPAKPLRSSPVSMPLSASADKEEPAP